MEPNWQNRTMWTGDNLDIMRGVNAESVALVYLDPPFSSNRNDAAPIGSEAADDVGLTHGKGMKSYRIMMAVRLLEMRRLLQAHRLPLSALRLHRQPLPQDANGCGVREGRIIAP